MLNKMAKSTILIFLSISLTLQLITALPYQNSLNSIDDNDIEQKQLQHTKIEKPIETEFRKQLRPVIFNTLLLLQQHSNTLITETASFIDDLIVELNLLPEENVYIQELISALSNLLERMEKLNLYDDSAPVLQEKAAILRQIAGMFRDFDSIAQGDNTNSNFAILKKVFEKLELNKLNERVDKSVRDAVEKFNKVFIPFWNALSDVDKKQHQNMSDWYERYQADETAEEKFKSFVDFIKILKSIIVDGE